MADADRLVAALNYLQEQKPADPLESFRSLAGLRDAYERRVQPIINNARQTFSTGGAMGDLLRSYGDAAAPGNAAALQGMGIPFKGPMTAPREEGFSSGENFRPMGDPQQQFAGQLLGDPMNLQPMVAPAARGAVAAGKYAGPELARGLENYMVKSGGILPMDVYHGSPHRFPPTAKNPLGEFDASKIGTGEGAQAYGAGAGYLAEAKSTAKTYSEQLAKTNFKSLNSSEQNSILPQMAALYDESKRKGVDAAKTLLGTHIQQLKETIKYDPSKQNIEALNSLLKLKTNKEFAPELTKYLYKVDLPDEHIAKMLDWDKPLSQQSAEVKAAFKLQDMGGTPAWDEITGLNLYNQLAGRLNVRNPSPMSGSEAASDFLKKAGIPGIRYLDQGSRAAPSSAQFVKADVVGAADDLTALAKSMGLDAEVRHSGSNAGKSSYVSVFDPMTKRYIKSSFRISDHGTGALRHQEHIHINSPADLVTQKNDLFEWVKRNRTEKGVDTTDLRAPSQGTSNFVVFDPAHMNIIGRE